MRIVLAVRCPSVPRQPRSKIFHPIIEPRCQTMGLSVCSDSWLKEYGHYRNSTDFLGIDICACPHFPHFFLGDQSAGSRYNGVTRIQPSACLCFRMATGPEAGRTAQGQSQMRADALLISSYHQDFSPSKLQCPASSIFFS